MHHVDVVGVVVLPNGMRIRHGYRFGIMHSLMSVVEPHHALVSSVTRQILTSTSSRGLLSLSADPLWGVA